MMIAGDSSAMLKHPEEKYWIESDRAELFFGMIIGLNSVIVGVEIEMDLSMNEDTDLAYTTFLVLYSLQSLCLLIFTLELMTRIWCRGCGLFIMPKEEPLDPEELPYDPPAHLTEKHEPLCLLWRLRGDAFFDLTVVSVSIVDLWVMAPLNKFVRVKSLQNVSALRILQLFRLLRIVRLLRISRELSMLVLSLAMSVRAVFWVFLLLFVFMYIGALICSSELGQSENENLRRTFGTIWLSIYSHFKILTLEAWPDICNWAMEESPIWALYFIAYIVIVNLALVNLLTGLIMDGVCQYAQAEDWSSELQVVEATPFVEAMRGLAGEEVMFDEAGFIQLLDNQYFKDLLGVYGITLRMEPEALFEVLDTKRAGSLSVDELATALLRLRGSREELHPALVRLDLARESQKIVTTLSACQQRLTERYEADVSQLERTVRSRLIEIERSMAKAKGLSFDAASEAGWSVGSERRLEGLPEKGGPAVGEDGEQEKAALAASTPRPSPEEAEKADAEAMAEQEREAAEAGAELVSLVKAAAGKVSRLGCAIRAAEAELQASLAREAALQAELDREMRWQATATQTDPPRALPSTPRKEERPPSSTAAPGAPQGAASSPAAEEVVASSPPRREAACSPIVFRSEVKVRPAGLPAPPEEEAEVTEAPAPASAAGSPSAAVALAPVAQAAKAAGMSAISASDGESAQLGDRRAKPAAPRTPPRETQPADRDRPMDAGVA